MRLRRFIRGIEADAGESGCTTLLKTIAGETGGIYVEPESKLSYQGTFARFGQTNLLF